MILNNGDINVLFLNPAPSLIKYGMYWGAKKCGCNAILLTNEKTRVFTESQQEQYKRIEEAIKKYDINVIFCEGYGNMNAAGIITLCKKYNVQYHHWAIEDPVTPHIGENFARVSDFIWTTTQEFISKYEGMGAKSDLLLFGCNPEFYNKVVPEDRFKAGVSIVGSNYDNRWEQAKEFVLPLLEDEFDPAVYGWWWMNETQPFKLQDYGKEKYYWMIKEGHNDQMLPYEWLPIVVNSSKVMIGLNCSGESITQTSCRPYETLCYSWNSVYLAWYTKAQDRIFGDYIYQAKTGKEMVEKARMLLNMTDEERQAKATKAREFVRNFHSYEQRFQQVAEKIKELDADD